MRMPDPRVGLVTSFLDAFQTVGQMDRQQRLDREAAAQQAVDNAFKKHQQDLEQERIKTEQEHYGALERQAAALEAHRLAQEDLARRKQDYAERLGDARLEVSRYLARSGAGARWERIETGMLRWMSDRSVPPDEQQRMLQDLRADYEFSTGSAIGAPIAGTPAGPSTLTGGMQGVAPGVPSVQPIVTNPLAKENLEEKHARTESTKQLTEDMHDLHKAQTTKVAADTKLAEANTRLRELQAAYIPKQFNFRVSEAQWNHMFKNKELNLREFSAQTSRIEAQLRANSNDQTAWRDAQNIQKWAQQYRVEATKVVDAARLKLNNARASKLHLETVIRQIRAMPKEQQDAKALVNAEGGLAGMTPGYFKDLELAANRAEKERSNANEALYRANGLNRNRVTPRGTIVPGAKLAPARVPAPGSRAPKGGLQLREAVPSIKSKAEYDRLPRGMPYRAPDGKVHVKS